MKFIFPILVLFLISCSSTPPPTPEKKVTQSVDRQAIRKTMFTHRRYIQNCYGKALVKKGSEHLKGILVIGFKIGPDGKAHSTKVLDQRSNLKNEQLSHCIIAGLKTWDFPVHPEGIEVSVNYPFVFRDSPPKNMQQKLDQFQKIKQQ